MRTRSTLLWAPLLVSLVASIAVVLVIDVAKPGHAAGQAVNATLAWRAKCGSCHGVTGDGHTQQGSKMQIPDLRTPAWQNATNDTAIRNQILNGIDRTKNGVRQTMPPFRTKLTAPQVDALVHYVRGLRQPVAVAGR